MDSRIVKGDRKGDQGNERRKCNWSRAKYLKKYEKGSDRQCA